MSDILTTITKIINSPPGQLAAGGVLAGIVWKFFERVEAVLTDQTKLEIAVWLVELTPFHSAYRWPVTFKKVFVRLFGRVHFSWQCWWRSCVYSYLSMLFLTVLVVRVQGVTYCPISFSFEQALSTGRLPFHRLDAHSLKTFLGWMAIYGAVGNVWFDYIALWVGRKSLDRLSAEVKGRAVIASLCANALVTVGCGGLAVFGATTLGPLIQLLHPHSLIHMETRTIFYVVDMTPFNPVWFWSTFFTSIWLWLYAGSGFLLKAARRFDIGFDWFNRHFDIEHKPLQSIGLVSGVLVAVVYWTAVIVSRVVG